MFIQIALSSFFTSVVISGTAYAFFKVDQTAGRLMYVLRRIIKQL